MIGQDEALKKLADWKERAFQPQFIVLHGPEGSGKMTMCREFSKKHKLRYVVPGTKVEDIRTAVDFAYRSQTQMLFVFDKAEGMSEPAKNALLKVTEEPPKTAQFIVLADSLSSLPATLLSRARTVAMSSYTQSQLVDFALSRGATDDDAALAAEFAVSPGEVARLLDGGVGDMYDFALLVADKIDKVRSANAFKSAQKLSFKKDDTEGWDIVLFLRMVRKIWAESTDVNKVWITTMALNEMQMTGLSRRATYDMWVLDIRRSSRESA